MVHPPDGPLACSSRQLLISWAFDRVLVVLLLRYAQAVLLQLAAASAEMLSPARDYRKAICQLHCHKVAHNPQHLDLAHIVRSRSAPVRLTRVNAIKRRVVNVDALHSLESAIHAVAQSNPVVWEQASLLSFS